jgi:hypothetical protein
LEDDDDDDDDVDDDEEEEDDMPANFTMSKRDKLRMIAAERRTGQVILVYAFTNLRWIRGGPSSGKSGTWGRRTDFIGTRWAVSLRINSF